MITGARVIMWANYRRGVGLSVPSPRDGDPSVLWWYDQIASLASQWALIGITDVLFPSPLKTNAGAFPGADGYMPFDDYDVGSKDTKQFGGIATRFGTEDQLRRAVAICHANGLNVLVDYVPHQRGGAPNGEYRYLGSDGHSQNGRFSKHPGCFRGPPPRVPEDPVPAPRDDFMFGDELCPINSRPRRYVWDGLVAASDWLFRTIDADGARLDDMKGMAIPFINALMSSGAMAGRWFVGEYASGNRNDTCWWVDQVSGKASAFDFDFHYNMVQPMCNDAGKGTFFMGSLAGRGMIGVAPAKAVPFVESMDSDTDGFGAVVENKELGYALMLCGEGLPAIFVKDYLEDSGCYGLHAPISNLTWIHQTLANGPTLPRLTDHAKVYVFERTGPPGLLVALNNDVWDSNWKTVTVDTNFGANTQIHDYTGHNRQDCWTDHAGRATFGVPPGADGRGYGCWSGVGHSDTLAATARSTTQVFFGAVDLSIPPAKNGPQTVGRVWAGRGSQVTVSITADRHGWTDATVIVASVVDEAGTTSATSQLGHTGGSTKHPAPTHAEGWHTLRLRSEGLPDGGSPFELSVTYHAPRDLRP